MTLIHIDADLANADWPKRTPDTLAALGLPDARALAGFDPNQPRDKDGKWGVGGSAVLPEAVVAEVATQDRLAAAQTNTLAQPPFLLGQDNNISNDDALRYLRAYGEEFTPALLPPDVQKGTPKECYRNASLLVIGHNDLDYAEGVAYAHGLPFLHAWAVTKDGAVVDPTWQHPEKSQYFGVRYDRAKYMKALFKQRIYGVLGSDTKTARRAIQTGGRDLR